VPLSFEQGHGFFAHSEGRVLVMSRVSIAGIIAAAAFIVVLILYISQSQTLSETQESLDSAQITLTAQVEAANVQATEAAAALSLAAVEATEELGQALEDAAETAVAEREEALSLAAAEATEELAQALEDAAEVAATELAESLSLAATEAAHMAATAEAEGRTEGLSIASGTSVAAFATYEAQVTATLSSLENALMTRQAQIEELEIIVTAQAATATPQADTSARITLSQSVESIDELSGHTMSLSYPEDWQVIAESGFFLLGSSEEVLAELDAAGEPNLTGDQQGMAVLSMPGFVLDGAETLEDVFELVKLMAEDDDTTIGEPEVVTLGSNNALRATVTGSHNDGHIYVLQIGEVYVLVLHVAADPATGLAVADAVVGSISISE
jgi:hypothetical protein